MSRGILTASRVFLWEVPFSILTLLPFPNSSAQLFHRLLLNRPPPMIAVDSSLILQKVGDVYVELLCMVFVVLAGACVTTKRRLWVFVPCCLFGKEHP